MEHQPKVSVIMPVYNTQAYVRQAVESILQQTLQELEVILINDGSTDGSQLIVHELAQQDSRVQAYDQPNQGQSVARNVGIAQATGEFLYFMDSDDLLEKDALECCYEKCQLEELDFVLFDAEILNQENNPNIRLGYSRSHCLNELWLYRGPDLMEQQLKHHSYTPSPCLNLIRATHLQRIGLRFYPGIIHEDQLFSALLYLQSEWVMYIDRPFFKRRLRDDSTMTRQFEWRNIEGYLTVARELILFAAPRYYRPQVRPAVELLLKQMLNAAVWQAHVLPWNERIRLFFICMTNYRPPCISYRTLATLLLKRTFNKQK